ncbi:MAG: 3-methyl-2-oxobutanoate hydroxymethyltransferase [Firmicutes bacterium]|jgi:3-methyl-2-oxobutanoate hydroxymethyltransferase|nr:3-methyl-2-oxobutanoate hydroxymethyltransferase [Bacillota bacterium]
MEVDAATRKVRVPDFLAMKARGERITMLTAYDYTMARLIDAAGIDAILVGDSVGNVHLGYSTTLPVTMEEMLHHTRAVCRGVRRALVVADLPFLSFQVDPLEAVRNAGRILKEGGADAVKIEGGQIVLPAVRHMVQIGIPVMGHLGLTPQSVHKFGGFRVQARSREAAKALLEDALALEDAGAFSIVLEGVPSDVAAEVTSQLRIPTIGIGAGPACDGQVLVCYDALGMFEDFKPKFVKRFAKLGEEIRRAVAEYCKGVREGTFPDLEHSYGPLEKTEEK